MLVTVRGMSSLNSPMGDHPLARIRRDQTRAHLGVKSTSLESMLHRTTMSSRLVIFIFCGARGLGVREEDRWWLV